VFGDPFNTKGNQSFFHWLNEPDSGPESSGCPVNRIWETVYRRRPDLQQAFPDVFGADHPTFCDWIVARGFRDHAISDAFAPQAELTRLQPGRHALNREVRLNGN
jgi:hypothetical protein